MGDLGALAAEDDLDDVDAHGNIRVAQEPQPRLRAAGNGLFLPRIDSIRRPSGSAGSAGFDLDEDERFLLAADEVDLAAMRRAKVAIEYFEAATAQMPRGEPLTLAAQSQVRGLRGRGRGGTGRPGEKSCDEWGKGHGV